jgi:hypothetical protein
MPRRSKLDLNKIRPSLTMTCTECGHGISADELRRVDFERVRCPNLFLATCSRPPDP